MKTILRKQTGLFALLLSVLMFFGLSCSLFGFYVASVQI